MIRKAKKEINYSRLILKYVGLTVAWTIGVNGLIYLCWSALGWFFEHINEINGWYLVFIIVFLLCLVGNLICITDEIDELKGLHNKEEE